MSYLKLPKTTQDHAVGFQSVNQAIDNNAALLAAFDLRHSIGVGGNSPYGAPTRAVGRHDDILIARTVVDFAVDTSRADPALQVITGGSLLVGGFVDRIAAGEWILHLATAQLFAAVALMKSTASVDRKATCYRTSSPSTGPAIYITTWDRSGGSWAPDDLPFSLVLWTQSP